MSPFVIFKGTLLFVEYSFEQSRQSLSARKGNTDQCSCLHVCLLKIINYVIFSKKVDLENFKHFID